MQAQLKVTPDNFFKEYVRILNPLLKLRKREAEVLESHLRVYYINHRLPDVDRLLFSFQTQKQIRQRLKMSPASYHNHKCRLRKKQVFIRETINPLIINQTIINNILKNNTISLTYIINSDTKLTPVSPQTILPNKAVLANFT